MGMTLRELKHQALAMMKAKVKPAPLLVALVFAVLLTAVSYFQSSISSSTVTVDEEMMDEFSAQAQAGDMPSFTEFMEAVEVESPQTTALSSFLNVALQALAVLLSAGFSLYALCFVRNPNSAELGNLLDGFGAFYRVCMIYMLRSLLVGLGLLCFVVPGILLYYSYRQAEYLMWDHPDWPPLRCLQASRLLMHGRRMKLFVLDVSFILLIYFSSMCVSLVSYFQAQALYGSMLCALIFGSLLSAFTYLYRELTYSLWYNYCLKTPEKKSESEDISQ